MKIKNRTLEDIILLLIIGQVVVFRFFNVYEIMNKVILVLTAMLLLINFIRGKKLKIGTKSEMLSIAIVVVLLLFNCFLYGCDGAFQSNMLMILYPLINVFYLTYYVKKHQEFFYKKMIQMKYLINIYFVINIIVMFIQLQGTYFLVGVVTQENTMYEDLISGLLGYSMVAAVCYFSVFVIAYNIVLSYTIKNRLRRKVFIAYTVILIGIMAYISIQNDNVQYFPFVLLALLIIMLSRNRLNTVSGLQKVLLIVLICMLAVMFALGLVPGFYELLNDSVLYKFTGSLEHMYDGSSVTHGSMERLALVVYGLTYAGGWALGKGFSYAGVYTPYTFGFVHFGNANIGAFICLGGVWLYLAIIYLYSKKIVTMIEFNDHTNRKLFYRIMVCTFLVAASMFSIPLTEVSIGLCVMFIMVVFGLNNYLIVHDERRVCCEK